MEASAGAQIADFSCFSPYRCPNRSLSDAAGSRFLPMNAPEGAKKSGPEGPLYAIIKLSRTAQNFAVNDTNN